MSLDATRWAWQQAITRSTDKLVLLSLADRANESHQCYPSIQRLASDTGCDRKTVMQAVRRLEESGLIEAAKARGKGTNYQLIGVPDRHGNPSQKRDQYRKRDQSHKGDGTSTENGTGPVPKTGHEPTKNQSTTKKTSAPPKKRTALDWSAIPESAQGGALDDWVEHRRQMKAPITSQRGVNTLVAELNRCEAAGITADAAITEAIDAGWRGIKLSWIQRRNGTNETNARPSNCSSTSRAKRVADTLDDIIRNGLPEERTERVGGSDLSETASDLRCPLDGEYRRH